MVVGFSNTHHSPTMCLLRPKHIKKQGKAYIFKDQRENKNMKEKIRITIDSDIHNMLKEMAVIDKSDVGAIIERIIKQHLTQQELSKFIDKIDVLTRNHEDIQQMVLAIAKQLAKDKYRNIQ